MGIPQQDIGASELCVMIQSCFRETSALLNTGIQNLTLVVPTESVWYALETCLNDFVTSGQLQAPNTSPCYGETKFEGGGGEDGESRVSLLVESLRRRAGTTPPAGFAEPCQN